MYIMYKSVEETRTNFCRCPFGSVEIIYYVSTKVVLKISNEGCMIAELSPYNKVK